MPECDLLEKCPFFNRTLPKMPTPAEMFKDLYCRRNFYICARYLVAKKLGREAVPLDLFPNHEAKARELLANAP